MGPSQNVKCLLRTHLDNLQVSTTSDMDDRIIGDALSAMSASKKARSAASRLSIGRAIMKSRITQLASAAAIIVVVGVLVGLFGRSATPAYAIEQTIEAIKKVSIMHIFGRDWDDKQIEMWAKVNPDTGLMEYCRIDYIDDDKVVLSTPQNTYSHDKRTNTIRIKDGPSVGSMFRLGEFFEGMRLLSERFDGQITYCEVVDPYTKQKLLELKMSSPRLEIRSLIDPQTKLPMNISVTKAERFGSHDTLKHASQICYDDVPPEGLFDFAIPAGANVVVETIEDPVQNLPVSVIQQCTRFHLQTLKTAEAKQVPVNTQIYSVDDKFNRHVGGFLRLHNDSEEVWTGEIAAGNFSYSNIAVFDASSGKKQQVRLVQRKQLQPGRFRLYWKLQEPLRPGQERYGIYWVNDPKELHKESSDGAYHLQMSNSFGCEAVENFILILPLDFRIGDHSRQYMSHENVDGYGIYIWQRHLPKHRISNEVDVSFVTEQTIRSQTD